MSDIQPTFIEKNGNADIGIYISEYKGKSYLHIREHYIEGRTGDRKPTKKGIAIDVAIAANLLGALSLVIGQHSNGATAKPATPAKAAKPATPKATKAKATKAVKPASPKAKASPKATKAEASDSSAVLLGKGRIKLAPEA